ncbi:hypothetical protein JSE7799_00243 [Jannaschia seosinensis]|uniref:Spore protein YkvP/CgeB glycosyl transferase-like domain-containing protein n=1 Tax=Jannaschia seosinensis TaxID=313367 RepID=A0A0M7B4H4_9RHOB|nr:glycosyltransferase [Jannaschia seosinensis]CUH13293.1 hypothetical protein JSE7799_00243 [Jannaschia seosinensis]
MSYDIVILGLSLSSSWGNGHATTWRSLLKGVAAHGKRVLFLERDVPWYADHRDLPEPDFCDLEFYQDLDELDGRWGETIANAPAVIVGSYVPEGVEALDLVLARAHGPVLFYDIDTPVTLATLSRGEEAYIHPRQIPNLSAYLSFSGGPALERLTEKYGARCAVAFHCCADESHYRPVDAERRWDLGYLGTYSPDRQPTLDRLLLEPARRLPHRRFVVAGPQYPADIDWPANVDRIEHLPPSEHPAFYAAQRYTLNVTRADMIAAGWSPSVRLFEAGACGTPVISDDWPGLTELLPDGDAILVAHSAEDVVNALEVPDDVQRDRLAQEARRRILENHTGHARAGQLLDLLADLARSVPRDAVAGAEPARAN